MNRLVMSLVVMGLGLAIVALAQPAPGPMGPGQMPPGMMMGLHQQMMGLMQQMGGMLQQMGEAMARGSVPPERMARMGELMSLGGVQPGWHRNQFTLRQTDELCVRAADRQRGNDLPWFDAGDTGAESIHRANQIPPRREGQPGRLGMNALARHDVGQGDAGGQHSHPHFPPTFGSGHSSSSARRASGPP